MSTFSSLVPTLLHVPVSGIWLVNPGVPLSEELEPQGLENADTDTNDDQGPENDDEELEDQEPEGLNEDIADEDDEADEADEADEEAKLGNEAPGEENDEEDEEQDFEVEFKTASKQEEKEEDDDDSDDDACDVFDYDRNGENQEFDEGQDDEDDENDEDNDWRNLAFDTDCREWVQLKGPDYAQPQTRFVIVRRNNRQTVVA
jgi:hypothetical protein